MEPEHRRHQRYDVDLTAMMVEGSAARGITVRNVSFDGLLAISDTPVELRKLVRFELSLPSDGAAIRLTAMAVYGSPPDENGRYRIGIQFFGLEPTTRQRWDRFIVELRNERCVVQVNPPEKVKPTRDRSKPPRVLQAGPPELRVLLESAEAVESVCAQLLGGSELMIRTDVRIALGRKIWLTLFHPKTARSVAVPAKVREQHVSPEFIGLSILPIVEETERAAIEDFEQAHVSITIELDPDALMGLEDVVRLETHRRAPLAAAAS